MEVGTLRNIDNIPTLIRLAGDGPSIAVSCLPLSTHTSRVSLSGSLVTNFFSILGASPSASLNDGTILAHAEGDSQCVD